MAGKGGRRGSETPPSSHQPSDLYPCPALTLTLYLTLITTDPLTTEPEPAHGSNQVGRGRTEPRVGYLVANPHQQNPTPEFRVPGSSQIWAFAQYNATYAFAQELQERFGVKHTLLGPPHFSSLPREHAARLNANLTVRFRTPSPPRAQIE